MLVNFFSSSIPFSGFCLNFMILDAVQEKLLNEYEAELKTKKPSHAKKDSNASDDWEKLSNESK